LSYENQNLTSSQYYIVVSKVVVGFKWSDRQNLTERGIVVGSVFVFRLKQRIRQAAALSLLPYIIGRVWQEMECRLDVCRAHIELKNICGKSV
jgi:hypothetical protein